MPGTARFGGIFAHAKDAETGQASPFPQTDFPGFAISLALFLEKRAQGKPGADCARSTVCNG
jgi:hypothetical protein